MQKKRIQKKIQKKKKYKKKKNTSTECAPQCGQEPRPRIVFHDVGSNGCHSELSTKMNLRLDLVSRMFRSTIPIPAADPWTDKRKSIYSALSSPIIL